MNKDELEPYLKTLVIVTLRDGSEHRGRLFDTPEDGLFT